MSIIVLRYSNIKRLLSRRIRATRGHVLRMRYYRGHGVHSPFVYSIVRDVFMFKKLRASETSFYHQLLEEGVNKLRANELHNLCVHCQYKSLAINSSDADFCLLTSELSPQDTLRIVDEASRSGATIALVSPYANMERRVICMDIIEQHSSTTVDNRGYLLVFNNDLPKQHFRI